MFKRVFLFFVTNLLVMLSLGIVISLVMNFTGLGRAMENNGLNLPALLVFCSLWGMGGSFVSLWISRWIAKRATGAQVLDPNAVSGDERWLVQTVYRLAGSAGITEMPEVAIYPSSEVNAFATGPSKNSALVAVSEGLLSNMDKDEIEGVLGHELSHVANGDMVTMALIQGVVNSFVMFLAWVLTVAIQQAMRGRDDERREGFGDFMLRSLIHNLLQGLLMFGAYLLVIAPFSRYREYRADAGGAMRAGKAKMIKALEALKGIHADARAQQAGSEAASQAPALAAFKIDGWPLSASTHPSLDDRIARLKQLELN